MIKLLQSIPDFKGKKRVSRILLNLFLKSNRSIKVDNTDGISYFLPNTIENISFEILVNGSYEPETIDFILSKLPPGAGMLDIGANIGAISIPVAKKRPDIQVINIEASARIFGFLLKNIELNNLKNCFALNKAVSDSDGELVNFFSPEDKFGKGSMAPVFTKIGQSVKTITIDRLCKQYPSRNIQFIKMDIEGFEYFAFKGGENLLCKEDAPDILFEFVDWAEEHAGLLAGKAQQLLLEYGYKLYSINRRKVVLMNKPQDKGSAMIFATKKHV